MNRRTDGFLRDAGVIAATTIGAGMFSLPYVFQVSGWLTGLFYLFIFSIVLVVCHVFYWAVLQHSKSREGLVGLVRHHLGSTAYHISFVAIIVGLLLALVVYLILGNEFLRPFAPALPDWVRIALFWFISSLPLFFKERRMLGLEMGGIIVMTAAIFLVFGTAPFLGKVFELPTVNPLQLFLPFGPVLFALAGWTAIEPLYRAYQKQNKEHAVPALAIGCGTLAAAFLYFLFVMGIAGSASAITPDTVSGLSDWPSWEIFTLSALGLFAIWTSYIPIALEVQTSLKSACAWKPSLARLAVLAVPPLLLFSGLDNFLRAVGLAGGIFLSLQYLFIVLVARRALQLAPVAKTGLNIIAAVFLVAVVYEIYYFFLG